MTLDEYAAEFARLSTLIDKGLESLRSYAREYADAEHDYRKAVATSWASAPVGTVPEREAWVNGQTAKHRQRRDYADAMRSAAWEAVRARRGQVSALQTMLGAHKEEAALARTAPEVSW